jgi:hypothetical protein
VSFADARACAFSCLPSGTLHTGGRTMMQALTETRRGPRGHQRTRENQRAATGNARAACASSSHSIRATGPRARGGEGLQAAQPQTGVVVVGPSRNHQTVARLQLHCAGVNATGACLMAISPALKQADPATGNAAPDRLRGHAVLRRAIGRPGTPLRHVARSSGSRTARCPDRPERGTTAPPPALHRDAPAVSHRATGGPGGRA